MKRDIYFMRKLFLILSLLVVSSFASARPVTFDYIQVEAPHDERYVVRSLDVDDKNKLRGVLWDGAVSCPNCWESTESLVSISKEGESIRITFLDAYGHQEGVSMVIDNPALFNILTLIEQGML